jgi:hypothetical protein
MSEMKTSILAKKKQGSVEENEKISMDYRL